MITIESFCNSVFGTSYSKVSREMLSKRYKEFTIPKKGGVRTINYLDRDSTLWKLQNKLLLNFLVKQDLPTCVKGFIKGESYHSFLSEHINSKFFLRIDISSFFPSITKLHIKKELSNLLVCSTDDEKEKLLNLICDMTTLNGSLPQGACTSPAISNLVMARIDQRVTKYCQIFHIKYTRYADDLLFSSKEFDFKAKKWFIKKMKHILASQNLKLNYSKIKIAQNKLILNGYIISDNGICLSRNRLSDIRHIVSFAKKNCYLINKFSKKEFLEQLNQLPLKHRNYPFKTVFQFVQYMCGYRAFLISLIDKNYSETSFQKELQCLIHQIELQILQFT